jgi:hypothetical protein
VKVPANRPSKEKKKKGSGAKEEKKGSGAKEEKKGSGAKSRSRSQTE